MLPLLRGEEWLLHSEERAVLRREPTRASHTSPRQDRSYWAEGSFNFRILHWHLLPNFEKSKTDQMSATWL